MKPRRFARPQSQRRYKKLFVIATEGTKTEPQYFSIFNHEENSVVLVKCLKGKFGSSPERVLKRMSEHINQEALRKSDAAWLVVDKDHWSNQQLAKLHSWAQGKDNYGFALSNPNFEFWLLLHFEDGEGAASRNCTEKLKRHLPNYDKGIIAKDFPRDRVLQAISRARRRDRPPCEDWPRGPGSTVYRLVSQILGVGQS